MILNLLPVFNGTQEALAVDALVDMGGLAAELPVNLPGPARVQGEIRNMADCVEAELSIDLSFVTNCARCLKELTLPYHSEIKSIIVQEPYEEEENNLDVLVIKGYNLDLRDLVETNLILNLELVYLCKEDCKGLCPVCGKDLNTGGCACVIEKKKNPFDALKNLL